MRKYCKAYMLKDLRQFSGWRAIPGEDQHEMEDEDICYLWDDYAVVKSPVQSGGVLFENVTPEWEEFCRTVLHFEIPEDLRYAYQA